MPGETTPNLQLPYIMAAQSQKHVTHNEAIRALDAIVQLSALDRGLSAPPGPPADGDRYIVAAGASGAWLGQSGKIAAFQDGAWMFYAPEEGWISWVADENLAVVYDGAGWTTLSSGGGGGGGLADVVEDTSPQLGGQLDVNGFALGDGTLELLKFSETGSAVNEVTIANAATAGNPTISATGDDTNITLALAGKGTGGVRAAVLGINANADTTNRLSVTSAAALFNHAGAGHQVKVNKNAAADTASFLFQTNFSGRAEIGTTGDDDFHFKVSADGSAFTEALILNKTTGAVTHKAGARSTFAHDATNAGLNLIPAAGDPSSPSNGDVWYNSTSGKFRKREAGATSDLDTTGGVSDGDKGDVTVSSSGATWTIDNNVVSFAKMADIATDRLIGRDTALSGDPEAITVGGGVEFTGSGGIQRSALTGDVTASAGNNATTIANDAVTNAKLANVATATLKGRVTASTGDPEDLTGTQATTLLDAFTSSLKGLAPASGGGTTNFLRADGNWASPGGGGGGGATNILLGSDVANSTTTLANVTGLSFTGSANTTYLVKLFGIQQSASTSTGIGLALDIPSGSVCGMASTVGTMAGAFNSTESFALTGDDALTWDTQNMRAANTNHPIMLWAIVAVGGTGGTVQLRMRSEVGSSAVTMKAGSVLSYQQVS